MDFFSGLKSKFVVKAVGIPSTSTSNALSSDAQAVAGAQSCSPLKAEPERASSSFYRHQQLRRNEIRLFVLRRGRRHEPLQTQIEHYTVDQTPQYSAISFVWGDRTDTEKISANGKCIKVTRTLAAALKGVRLPREDRIIWADQICINQLDEAEKTEQVQLMSAIYPRASTVLCWLGEDDGTVDLAFHILRKWAAVGDEDLSQQEAKQQKLRSDVAAKAVKALSEHAGAKDALARLFNRSWWRRAWTLQEVCPSKSNRPILVCGQHQLLWYHFYLACYNMFNTLDGSERTRAFSSAITYVLPMLQTSWADKETLRLSRLIHVAAKREATDPRDKIYALLGLTAPTNLRYPDADYTLSAEQACVKYTRAIIEREQNLDVLMIVARPLPNDNRPSWCMKIENLGGEHPLDFHNYKEGGEHRFDATLGQPPCMTPPRSAFDTSLQLRGAPVDTVERLISATGITGLLESAECTWPAVLQCVDQFCTLQGLPSRYGPTDACAATALLNTITTGRFYVTAQEPLTTEGSAWYNLYYAYQSFALSHPERSDDTPLPETPEALVSYVQEEFNVREQTESGEIGARNALEGSNKSRLARAWLERRVCSDLQIAIKPRCDQRCIFQTRTGYLGLGPLDARPGDHVCLLLGSSVPFLLRRRRDCLDEVYDLLDEVYCEGIMQGEGLSAYVVSGDLVAPVGGWSKYTLV